MDAVEGKRIAPARRSDGDLALSDLRDSLSRWRIWWMLGTGDVRQRYRRSRLGQFWITLSMAAFVAGIGVLYSQLLRVPADTYIPFLATNIVVWGLISGILTDSSTMFTASENFLRNEAMPKSIFALRILVRNLVIFAHNLIIIPVVFLFFGQTPSWTWLLVPFGLVFVTAVGFLASLLTGILATRFRDLPQIIANVIQVAFFLTPVTWPAASLPGRGGLFVDANPFAIMLHLVSEPMRGIVPSAQTYLSALAIAAILAAVAIPLFARYRARIVYWL
jgi:lipopolysaccharide transport system permease protein